MKKTYSETQAWVDAVNALRKKGLSLENIAIELKTTVNTLADRMKKLREKGYFFEPVKRQKMKNINWSKLSPRIQEMYVNGAPTAEISRSVGIHEKTIQCYISSKRRGPDRSEWMRKPAPSKPISQRSLCGAEPLPPGHPLTWGVICSEPMPQPARYRA
ncbi:helix-turn-helix domain-containing protein [Swingsia samuiensis]|uniref:Uncharacterized protein n=1 Tax=Swingsia samuiensis TaxID=1293412 RepID=A0A4Y6UN18_9PROT|nr:hypothetical protein [Swingsia samuiensis]QDH17435.1 hypothetical protein E3D00_07555 [Swingsia samuiensis]